MQYLKNEQYYIDRYDLLTIKQCLDAREMFQKIYEDSFKSKELKHLPKREKYKGANYMLYEHIYRVMTSAYKRKEETIQKWIDEDKLKQDKQDNAPVPDGIYCPLCNASMYFNSTKNLDYTYDSPIVRMMFLFKCSKCKKQQWVYDDGEIRVSEPDLCPKCKKEIEITVKRKGKVITWKHKCKACGFTKTEVEDLAKKDKEWGKKQVEWKKKEQEDKELLEKYRSEFCLSDEEGKKHIETLEALEFGNQVYEEELSKYDTLAFQTAVQLEKLSITELEKLLNELLEKENYSKLSFDKPEIGRHVFVPFTAQEANSSRNKHDTVIQLEKIIKEALGKTNWRLVSNSIVYRLGYVSGSLKGYEQEEDLLEISGMKKEQKKSKIDPEQMMKYGSHRLVQMARVAAEHKGINDMRKRRLEKEPEGFFLTEDSDGTYTCGVCRDHYPGNKIWWNLDGIRCADCWTNIKEGVIPPLKWEHDGVWIPDFALKSDYNVHPSSVRKLRREGLLKGRDLKREDGSIYCTVYLVSENKEFLKKYPKKEIKMKLQMLTFDGKVFSLE